VGGVLLLVFVAAIIYLIKASHGHAFLINEEIEEAEEEKSSLPKAVLLTLGGIGLITLGGELVTQGAENIIGGFGIPAAIMGMVVTPAAIELEEIIRQAVPSKAGRHDISAGNLIGTLLYFLLFNNAIIALLAPVKIDPQVVRLDFPFLVVITFTTAIFLWRGKVGRGAGLFLVTSYLVYVGLHFIGN
jgi:cation:H+ antiporter